MKEIVVVAALIFPVLPIAFGQTTGGAVNRNNRNEMELLRANQEYDEALVRGDAAALDRIYSDDFIYTTPDGEVRDKAQQISFTRSGDLRLESGLSDDVRIRIYGNMAVMTGRFTARGQFKDKNIDIRERYTAVWFKKTRTLAACRGARKFH
jgi:ketosteroid isomerase-like protein